MLGRLKSIVVLAVAGACVVPIAGEAQQMVYRWQDSTGVHYGDICPAGATCGAKRVNPSLNLSTSSGGSALAATTGSGTIPSSGTATSDAGSAGGTIVAGGATAGSGSGGGASAGGGGGGGGGGTAGSSAADGGGRSTSGSTATSGTGSGSTSTSSGTTTTAASTNTGTTTTSSTTTSNTTTTGTTTSGTTATSTTTSSTTTSSTDPTTTASTDGSSTTATSSPSLLSSAVGTNLNGVSYYSPEIPFADVMKTSSPWISGDGTTWDNGQALDLDANGWVRSLAPGQIARKLMLRSFGDKYPAGQYIVRYDGQGTMNFKFAAQVVSRSPGQIVLQVTPTTDGLYMEIAATDSTNYIRNIRITTPGGICQSDPFTRVDSAAACTNQDYRPFADNPGLYFNPEFLKRLRGYSVLRFMDWMSTNSSPVTSWSQRTPLGYSTWATTGGVPAEVMVMLANVLHARPWFNMPAKADDGYVSSFAQLVNAQLDPSLVVYVEDSNEVWNSQFGQYTYESQQAATQSPTIDIMQFHALRTRTIGQTFKAALGANRVVTVLGAQAASTYTASHGLDYLRSQFGASAIGIDAVAIAPYMMVVPDSSQAATFDAMTLDQFFAYVQTQVLPQALGWVAKYHTLANNYGVHLISYEGGQHMVGHWGAENDATLNTLFDAFNRDPRIKQLYLDYLAGWKQNGGELFVHFCDVGRYDKWGRWGGLEYLSEARGDAPKYDGLQTFIEQNPVWWTQ